MTEEITFKQIKPKILASLHLEKAEERLSGYSTEYEMKYHPRYPKKYLIWAEFKDERYVFYELKVLDTQSDKLVYAIGMTQISKSYLDKDYGKIDSDRFKIFKQSNRCEDTSFFRERMEQLMSIK
jgi:hypothetical protein